MVCAFIASGVTQISFSNIYLNFGYGRMAPLRKSAILSFYSLFSPFTLHITMIEIDRLLQTGRQIAYIIFFSYFCINIQPQSE